MSTQLNVIPICEWQIPGAKKPFIIAGPCSAETKNQVLKTAKELAKYHIKIFRAGIWKPRTRPGNFEGVGLEGLAWLKSVKQETNMLVSTEVANGKHVYAALKSGVDILWIGARTSVNPFAVQEIADALSGVDIPVLVKNPINPDVELWIGAIERLNKAGITRLAALHRGFSESTKSQFRNEPLWQIPIEMRKRIRNLSIICDPSHISGNRSFLLQVAKKSLDLNFDGLMIESHINPDVALSDSKQQLTPESVNELLNKLILRQTDTNDVEYHDKIEELRTIIDDLDTQSLNLIEKRMKIVSKIGRLKKLNNVTILKTARWNTLLKKNLNIGVKKGLSKEFICKMFKNIHQESISTQTSIMCKMDKH